MNVLIVSGIWPPDVGGPASHAPEVAAFLANRGHAVEVVVTADGPPAPCPFPVHHTSRRLPVGLRHAASLALVARLSRRAQVIYSTGMFGRTGLAAMATRRPYVLKLTGDPAFERLRARGAVEGGVEQFQGGHAGIQATALTWLRNLVVRHAFHVYVPSEYLRGIVAEWGADVSRVTVLPNPTPAARPALDRQQLREQLGLRGPTLVFAGRLTAQKALDVLARAVADVAGVTLVVAGDGDRRAAMEQLVGELGIADRVRFTGAVPRDRVLELFAAADAAVLASAWENFPHTVVEALAVGTPVIATAAGGVPEVVEDGVNGLLVPVGDAGALASAIRRFFADEGLRERLRSHTVPSVDRYRPETLLVGLESMLREAVAR